MPRLACSPGSLRTPEVTLQDPVEGHRETPRLGLSHVRPLRQVEAAQLRVVREIEPGSAGGRQQAFPGALARPETLFVLKVGSLARQANEEHLHATRAQLCHCLGRALDL